MLRWVHVFILAIAFVACSSNPVLGSRVLARGPVGVDRDQLGYPIPRMVLLRVPWVFCVDILQTVQSLE